MEQKNNHIQQKPFVNPYTEAEVIQAVQKAVEKTGFSAFKAFLNDYKLIPVCCVAVNASKVFRFRLDKCSSSNSPPQSVQTHFLKPATVNDRCPNFSLEL